MWGGGGTLKSSLKSQDYITWFFSEDIFYFQNQSFLELNYKLEYKLIINPNLEILNHLFANNENFHVLASFLPPKDLQNLFIIKELENKYGVLTTQEFHANISENQALQNRLGLSVIKSPFNLASVGGAKLLKKFTQELIKAENHGYKAKAIFLVGIPGTGKTFFPKCFAGELDRLLIQLNLTLIMESSSPIDKLNSIFTYLHKRHEKYPEEKFVILIDEIEKMIGNSEPLEKRMLGRLLTVLNDVNTKASEYNFDAIFFATANDLNVILDNNPELLRRGRFDELFFINLPDVYNAKEIFELYLKNYNLHEILHNLDIDVDKLISFIEIKYSERNPIIGKFPYTPAEIENLCKRIYFIKLAKDNIYLEDILECIDMIIPITLSAQQGILKMAAQKELFVEI